MIGCFRNVALRGWIVAALVLLAFGGSAMATEEPSFNVLVQEGEFEVRDYSALIAAEVSVTFREKTRKQHCGEYRSK